MPVIHENEFSPRDDEKSNGIPQAVPTPYPSYTPGRNRRGSTNWHSLFPNLAIFMAGQVFKLSWKIYF